jgi:hypothetical protein
LKTGTFFVDESASTIHVWPPADTNMQTAVVESASHFARGSRVV